MRSETHLEELAYSTRPPSAAWVKELRLAPKVVGGRREEILTAALELTEDIAEKSPVAVKVTEEPFSHTPANQVGFYLRFLDSPNISVPDNLQYNVARGVGGVKNCGKLPSPT